MKKAIILVALLLSVKTQFSQNWNQIIKIVSSDRTAYDYFGYSVALSGEYAIVGAYGEDHDVTGLNPMSGAGSAYILKNNSGVWTQVQKIVASDRAADDYFGYSVAISGNYAVVGANQEDHDVAGSNSLSNAGSIYIFKNNTGTWEQTQKLTSLDRAVNDYFGSVLSISDDYIIVGVRWEDEDISGANTKEDAGSAYIFKNNSGTWSQVQKIVASDRTAFDLFGTSVSISGDYAIIGAPGEDEDAIGSSTRSQAGSAYILKNNSGVWSQIHKIVATDRAIGDNFGSSVAIAGNYAIIGAPAEDENASGLITMESAGSVYVFQNIENVWYPVQKVVATDRAAGDNFGSSVAISGIHAIVGASGQDQDASGSNTLSQSGSAYLLKNTSDVWSQVQKIVASDRASEDYFGVPVSISGDYAIIGAYAEDEDASGFNTMTQAGSMYIFGNMDVLPVELTSFTANYVNGNVGLKWTTATEVNNYGFNVERRETGNGKSETWVKIGFVQGSGNSNSPKEYLFVDSTPPSGKIHYRLKQVDFDGQFEYSGIVEVIIETPTQFSLQQNYPNPFNPITTIKYSIPNVGTGFSLSILKVYDILGSEVAVLVNEMQPAGNYEIQFDGSKLASGVYIYKLQSGNYSSVKKFMLLK
jgi:hypothetical protein